MTSPRPAQLSGKAENSFCSLCLLGQVEHTLNETTANKSVLNPQIECFFPGTCRALDCTPREKCWLALKLNDSPAYSYGDSLRAIACAKFLHNVFDVALYRLLRDKEQRCYIAISISSCHLVENFHLTFA